MQPDNHHRWLMSRICLAAIAICAYLPLVSPVRAEPARAALVIGNATYTAMPGVPGCAKSANTVAAALRALGFQVTERQDASTGGIDGGVTEFSQRLAAGGAAFVYACGYATDFNNRTFLLPTTAQLSRPSDVMTQGLLAKSLVTAASRYPSTTAVVAFDLVAAPGGSPRVDTDALANLAVPDGVGIIAATETAPADAPTPLAAALVAALAGPTVRTDTLFDGVRTKLAGTQATVAALHMPVQTGFLAGAPPPVVAAKPTPAVATKPPAVPVPAAPAAPAPSPAAALPPQQLPDESQMTDADRRQVQAALVHLGYYDKSVDGLFGPDTRAAIRRYQHEIGVDMTGQLTAAEATRLVNTP